MSSIDKPRSEVLKLARKMARSGQFADFESVKEAMRKVDGFAQATEWIGQRSFRAQIDRLCAMARNPTIARIEFGAMRRGRITPSRQQPSMRAI